MKDKIRLDGKVALVTGAAGVIGTETIQLLALRGAKIVAVDRDAEALKTAISKLNSTTDSIAITADVTNEDDVARYVAKAVEAFGTIDIFFNNAGIEGSIAPVTKTSLEDFQRVLNVNVVGVFLGMKHVIPVMQKQKSGSIINTASVAGLYGAAQIAAYSASKHAVIGLTKSVADECSGSGIRVNCICPGLIDSRMWSAIFEGRQAGKPVSSDRVLERIPARRLGAAEEVAPIVAFLASEDAAYVNGASYVVDGGRSAS